MCPSTFLYSKLTLRPPAASVIGLRVYRGLGFEGLGFIGV